ncbi:MAG: protein kinase [Lachnospiraceae bacterium]|nr:protein kinase [Lachnospiraceae bacterium]
MNVSHSIFDFTEVTTINEDHGVFLVKHNSSGKLFIKKILSVYNLDVYKKLLESPIPGTPRIVCMEEVDNHLILIETFISGTSLEDLLDKERVSPESSELTLKSITKITLDILGVLKTLHAMEPPVIHRDIKPSNIIITETGDAVLLDFNAAKKYNPEASADTRLLGTMGYAAPEQYGFGSSSPQTDIYSLGIVLKNMLEACPETSESLSAIAEKCSMLDPKDRYMNVEAVIADIKLGAVSGSTDSEESASAYGEMSGISHTDSFSAYGGLSNKSNGTVSAYNGLSGTSNEITSAYDGLSSVLTEDAPEKKYPNKLTSFFPPGFRSLNPIRIVIAGTYYVFWGALCLSITSDKVKGNAIWAYRLMALLIFVLPVFTIFNYKNIQGLIPLCKSKLLPLRILGLVLLNALLFLVWALVLSTIPGVHS